jgi:oligoendopeptidase F
MFRTKDQRMSTTRLPLRSEVPAEHTWDLSSLFRTDAEWEAAFVEWEKMVDGYGRFRGKLGDGPAVVAECLRFDTAFDRAADRVGTYAFLRETEDVANGTYQGMKGRYLGVAAKAMEAASYIRPELLALPEEQLNGYIASPDLSDYRLSLTRLARYKPHTLGEKEERLLALQMESAQTAREAFGQLTNADMKFGTITIGEQTIELSHGSYSRCLENPDREVRKAAFHQYYAEFKDHANTLAATLSGSVRQDVYVAKVRNYSSAREAALFPDQVPTSVYDNLISAVRANLPKVHKYYEVRRRAMKLPKLHFYDTYVPILTDFRRTTEWDDAVNTVVESLAPLGPGYIETVTKGLKGRWCDRYENKGKRSGAFSSGCYDSDPYILMNYQPDVLDHVYTLTHEAGHSLHTHFSKGQPYQYAGYTIFVAEVASTFNEQLLTRHYMSRAKSDLERAYFLNREIDGMRGTIVRQTMFAEFETLIHAMAERNEPLTLDALRAEYRKLLEAYLGPGMEIDEELSLECLRIPHFYNAFYVYKYATGLAAAIALSNRVVNGGKAELEAYLNFLKGGSSKDPLDLLRDAGVDMATPEPVNAALAHFGKLVDELDGLLK